ncbi:modification methylase [Vibrio parahaemolyticus]|nr:modification methylase [Vibrio parahaemolyticus]EGU9030359.1 modification methylase [Vibrio parahaemolyticus]EHR0760541.1 Eco57I restriction-modification methylase domain-containing protein [Vibrio parahaemolyticus]EHR0831248.1 Eco57I restriction-modification methylase domain-containing protein [Vibrio parahaemolyticus]EHR1158883.1 Eco57I restriction-modification methylase domain-containing protein [Vibrio parahaemolyticus]
MTNNTATALQYNALETLVDTVDEIRTQANGLLDEDTRGQKGQFMTPASAARILSGMFRNLDGELNILDAGAGVGSLTTSLVERALREFRPTSINANAWELEDVLVENLNRSFVLCQEASAESQVAWGSQVNQVDFIQNAVDILKARKDGEDTATFNKAILNPPYLKIAAASKERKNLRSVGVETGNLYSCFVALALMLLEDGGELVAITPRSFCNGPYFNDFRRLLLNGNNLSKLHIFESRTRAFKGDKVLQENVIFHIVKGEAQGQVEITSSTCADDPAPIVRMAEFNEVVNPNNPDRFIHIVTNDEQAGIATRIGGMPCSLVDLGIEASTGKVVDFRTKPNLRHDPAEDTVPLIYPMHFNNCMIEYPVESKKKPNAIALNDETMKQMVPNGTYVLTKRLTSKEETRRIVAGLYTADLADVEVVGFENKTNYFHADGQPLEMDFAKGLWVYLNSNIVDQYFRQFNGHTQVNATDLRTLRYPTREQLITMGQQVEAFDQEQFDALVENL